MYLGKQGTVAQITDPVFIEQLLSQQVMVTVDFGNEHFKQGLPLRLIELPSSCFAESKELERVWMERHHQKALHVVCQLLNRAIVYCGDRVSSVEEAIRLLPLYTSEETTRLVRTLVTRFKEHITLTAGRITHI